MWKYTVFVLLIAWGSSDMQIFQLRSLAQLSQGNLLDALKSVQSTLSHLITTSVPCAMYTHFLVEHG